MATTMNQEDPAAIEQDIRRTQEEMSRTVDQIGDQLTPKKLLNALLDKADESGIDVNYLLDGARRNPMALGLIAAGAIWLVSDKDSRFPSIPKRNSDGDGRDYGKGDLEYDVQHRDYVAHMSSLEVREHEDAAAYQRRRDQHRANFLMCERGHDEDDKSFRQRLDQLTETFREKRRAWSDSAGQTGSNAGRKTQQTVRRASDRTQELFTSNPLVGGILAAALGAALGSTIPVSRSEQEKLGDIGGTALDKASEGKEALMSRAAEKKDEFLERADQRLQGSDNPQSQQSSGARRPEDEPFGSENQSGEEAPSILSGGPR